MSLSERHASGLRAAFRPPPTVRTCVLLAAVLSAFLVLAPARAPAQSGEQRLIEQRNELERIRRERETLEREATSLRSRAYDLGEEVSNLDRRAAATSRIVATLERQLALIADEVDSAQVKAAVAEREYAEKHEALKSHLVDIYKRGPLYTEQALLSATSFGELIARYKYLHNLTLRDRALVHRVEQLRNTVAIERDRLVALQDQLEFSRSDKTREEAQLRALQRQQAAALRGVQQRQRNVETRIAEHNRTIAQLTNAIAALDAARRRTEATLPAGTARPASSIRTSDYGRLDWPLEGDLVYTFGKAQTASNTVIRWNGVGIAAPANSPVRTVAPGRVVSVGQLGTYGLTVIIDHGGGDYSVYGSLSRSDVKLSQTVTKGQIIGGAGVSDPDIPPHLHFEIRSGNPIPAAVDPATWLKGRR